MDLIKELLEKAGYDFAIAFATEEEVKNNVACGQLAAETKCQIY